MSDNLEYAVGVPGTKTADSYFTLVHADRYNGSVNTERPHPRLGADPAVCACGRAAGHPLHADDPYNIGIAADAQTFTVTYYRGAWQEWTGTTWDSTYAWRNCNHQHTTSEQADRCGAAEARAYTRRNA